MRTFYAEKWEDADSDMLLGGKTRRETVVCMSNKMDWVDYYVFTDATPTPKP